MLQVSLFLLPSFLLLAYYHHHYYYYWGVVRVWGRVKQFCLVILEESGIVRPLCKQLHPLKHLTSSKSPLSLIAFIFLMVYFTVKVGSHNISSVTIFCCVGL